MSEPKWTPGPWELREVAHGATHYSKRMVYRMEIIAPQYLYGKRTHSRDIAQMVDFCDWIDHPHNARLICAAPDLYAALIAITDQLERIGDSRKDAPFIEEARAALAKARGEDDVEAV